MPNVKQQNDYFCPMNKLYFAFLLFLSFSIISCNGVKSLTKKGDKAFEKAQFEKAVELYFSALEKDKEYSLAKTGLKNSGQRLVNNHLDQFFKTKNFGENRKAIYHYRDASRLSERCSRMNVSLDIPTQYTSDYNILTNEYVAEQYDKGMKLLQNEAFLEAENTFREIKLLKPNYKDVDDLERSCRV